MSKPSIPMPIPTPNETIKPMAINWFSERLIAAADNMDRRTLCLEEKDKADQGAVQVKKADAVWAEAPDGAAAGDAGAAPAWESAGNVFVPNAGRKHHTQGERLAHPPNVPSAGP